MKQLTFITKFLFLALAVSFMSSCEEDGTGGGVGGGVTLPPVISLQSGTDVITGPTTVDAGATFMVNVVATKSDFDLTTFTVLEDGIAIEASRVLFNGTDPLGNPYTLGASENSTFDTNISITAHTDGGTRTYTFRITDTDGNNDDTSIDITVSTTPLAIGFETANGGVAANLNLSGQSTFKVEISATKGGSQLSTLTVKADGTAIDATRVRFNTANDLGTATVFPTNPLDLIDTEKDAFTFFVWVSSHDAGTQTYSYEIEDEAGNTESVSFDVDVFTGTPVAELTGKLLKNAGGGQQTGGMNLFTGESINSTDVAAHIKDQGIDINLPVASNWRKKIAPANGSILRTPSADFPASGFEDITISEEVTAAFGEGTEITETEVVNVGDVFLVQAATGEFYIIKVTNIDETTMNNEDFYELTIKQ